MRSVHWASLDDTWPRDARREVAQGMESYDVAVIGAGLGGINAAAQAAALGARVALIEANKIGGT